MSVEQFEDLAVADRLRYGSSINVLVAGSSTNLDDLGLMSLSSWAYSGHPTLQYTKPSISEDPQTTLNDGNVRLEAPYLITDGTSTTIDQDEAKKFALTRFFDPKSALLTGNTLQNTLNDISNQQDRAAFITGFELVSSTDPTQEIIDGKNYQTKTIVSKSANGAELAEKYVWVAYDDNSGSQTGAWVVYSQ